MHRVPALALLCLLGAGPAAAAEVGETVRAQVRADGAATVLVALRAPAVPKDARRLPARRAAVARLRERVIARLGKADAVVERRFTTLPGFTARVTAAGLARLAADPDVARIGPDGVGHAALQRSVPQIRGDRVHARGVIGEGTVIAVLDSGIEATHPDVDDALLAEECFCRAGTLPDARHRTACCPNGTAHQSGAGSAATGDVHGPFVAGVALSRGRMAGVGVAPGALLVAVRVLDDANAGFFSDWIAALDWIAAERPEVRVVNMSLVSDLLFREPCDRRCEGDGCAAARLFADVVEQLWQRGTLVFAAAGNDGRPDAISLPACVERAIAVGAVDADDAVYSFSNGGAGLDLLAPGVSIVSDGLDGGLAILTGTSAATPHAAGTAALLLSARPGLSAEQVESLLASTGVPVLDPRTRRATARVDAFAAFVAATRVPELARGGGSRATDCLLEWNVIPPDLVAPGTPPTVRCIDGDPFCDLDTIPGRCTFALSVCFNMRDPLLRRCSTDEPLLTFAIHEPTVDAAPGTVARQNVDALSFALPDFPFTGRDACSLEIPFVVERPGAGREVSRIRMRVRTATRSDYDQIVFECAAP